MKKCTFRFAILLLVGTVLAPRPAAAGHDVKRTLDFLGFSDDGSRYVLKVVDPDSGDFLSVRSFATGKQEKSFPIEQKKDEKRVVEQVRKQYAVTDKGTDAQASPDGRYTIVAVPKGDKLLLDVMRGDKTAKWVALPLESGRNGPAKPTLKSVFWAKDGHRLVVMLHQFLAGDDGVDLDAAHPFEFHGGEMNFK